MSHLGRHPTILNVYNSLTRRVEQLTISKRGNLNWYACGPTVYDDAHIGHLRCYLNLDLFRRIINHYDPNLIFNLVIGITDIDDKIIHKSQSTGQTPAETAKAYEENFFRMFRDFNILTPSAFARVTDYIPEIFNSIQTLLVSGYAYKSKHDDTVYFSTESYEKGQFKYPIFRSKNESLGDNTTVKKNSRDFALWKTSNLNGCWDFLSKSGRPGWHIECSSMINEIFGDNGIDVHSGGIDLDFPHHENEIALSQASGFTNSWCSAFVHSGLVYYGEKKMSKSLGNFICAQELLCTDADPDSFRYLCLLRHYRDHLRFTMEDLKEAHVGLQKLKNLIISLDRFVELSKKDLGDRFSSKDKQFSSKLQDFSARLRNDLLNDFCWHHIWKEIHMSRGIVKVLSDYCNDDPMQCHPLLLKHAKTSLVLMLQIFGLKIYG